MKEDFALSNPPLLTTTDGSRIYKEERGSDTLWYHYDNTGITGIEYNGAAYYFQKNIQGDVVRIYDGNGSLKARYEYDAWGNHRIYDEYGVDITEDIVTGGQSFTFGAHIGRVNPFRYRGYYYDAETKLYYLESRYYDAAIGRFINADDVAYIQPDVLNGSNLYAYCGNNPVVNKQISWRGSNPAVTLFLVGKTIINLYNGVTNLGNSSKVNWGEGGFQIPIWISSLLSGSDFGASIAPALRTIYQFIRFPGIKDLNKLYGLDFVPGKLNTVTSVIGYGLLGVNILLSGITNFTNSNLTTKQQWISFGVDTAYTLGTFAIGYGVGALVSLIPGVGVFLAPFVSAGVTWLIDWTNNQWGWLDAIKQWFNDL